MLKFYHLNTFNGLPDPRGSQATKFLPKEIAEANTLVQSVQQEAHVGVKQVPIACIIMPTARQLLSMLANMKLQ